MKLVLLGLTIGAVAGYGLTRLLASEFFEQRAWQRQLAEQLYQCKDDRSVDFRDNRVAFDIGSAICLLAACAQSVAS